MNKLRPYTDKSGNKRMLESVVCFADVLGFTDRVKDAYKNDKESILLEEFDKAISSTYPYLQEKVQDFCETQMSWVFKAFSDSIVIGFPIENADKEFPVKSSGEAELSQIFHMLSVFQLTMIQHGFFMRGGISIGKLYMDDETVFGHAFLRAYETESREAIYPRLVLDSLRRKEPPEKSYLRKRFEVTAPSEESSKWQDPSAAGYVKLHLSSYSERSWSSHYKHVLEDGDKQLFLNYLGLITAEHHCDESESSAFLLPEHEQALIKHKDEVEVRLEEFSRDSNIWNKYAWVARYHNYFCDQHSSIPASYKIDASRLSPGRLRE